MPTEMMSFSINPSVTSNPLLTRPARLEAEGEGGNYELPFFALFFYLFRHSFSSKNFIS
jgi:hypothetical protein